MLDSVWRRGEGESLSLGYSGEVYMNAGQCVAERGRGEPLSRLQRRGLHECWTVCGGQGEGGASLSATAARFT